MKVQFTEEGIGFVIPYIDETKPLTKEESRKLHEEAISFFRFRLIESLKRRKKACLKVLINHLDDIDYCDGNGTIHWIKEGKYGTFNVGTYEGIDKIIETLAKNNVKSFLDDPFSVDQTLKALLNDTEQNHEDEGNIKYSKLVSVLCLYHAKK